MGFSRPKTLTCTMVAPIWSVITFVNSLKIISTWLVLWTSQLVFLQLHFFKMGSTSASNRTRPKLNAIVPSLPHRTNLKLFSGKGLKNLSSLWLTSGLRLSGIFNISKRKFKIEFYTCSISNQYLWNLTQNIFQQKKYFVDTTMRGSSLLLDYALMKKAKTWMIKTP